MNGQLKIAFVINVIVLCAVASTNAENVQVKINVQTPLHVVNDAFVSFQFPNSDMIELQRLQYQPNDFSRISQMLSPAYIKLSTEFADTTPLISATKWLNSIGLKPVLGLPYSTDWSTRKALRLLGTAHKSGPTTCIWQLGSALNVSDPIRYLDDLATLREISDAFNDQTWGVIGADISASNTPDEAQFYVDLSQNIVDSVGWTRSYTNAASLVDETPGRGEDPTTINAIEDNRRPIWINFRGSGDETNSDLTHEQRQWKALNWALTLGTSAQQGYSVIFKPSSVSEVVRPTFDIFVSLIHKKLMGNKVLEARLKGRTSDVSLFAHCSRNISGAFTLMGVNLASEKHTVSSTLPTGTTGVSVLQYILSSDQNGVVTLNDKPLDTRTPIESQLETRKKQCLTRFTLPAKSVAFWVFSEANVNECLHQEYFDQHISGPKTASQKLLHELLVGSGQGTRVKRDIGHLLNDGAIHEQLDPTKTLLMDQMMELVKELQQMSKQTDFKYLQSIGDRILRVNDNYQDKYQDPDDVNQLNHKPYRLRQKCKILALNLEQQCLRDTRPNKMESHLLIRPKHTKRSGKKREKRNAQWMQADDIRTNEIPKDATSNNGAQPASSVISTMYWQDEYGVVHEVPIQLGGHENNQGVSVRQAEAVDVGNIETTTSIAYTTPKFMKSFSKSVENLLDLMNQHVGAWWTAMS